MVPGTFGFCFVLEYGAANVSVDVAKDFFDDARVTSHQSENGFICPLTDDCILQQ